MSSSQLKNIEAKLDDLIRLCNHLEKENATLQAKEASWEQERKRLIEKNEIARKRVEAMIEHLKNLETES
ncbi:MAG: TIGR02449 family protein [Agarilytica sp.]